MFAGILCEKGGVPLSNSRPWRQAFKKVHLLLEQGQIFQARDYVKALAKQWKDPTILWQGALAFKDRKQYEAAVACIETLLAKSPRDGKSWRLLGHMHYEEKHWTQAQQCYEKASVLQAVDGEMYFNWGVMQKAQGNILEALSCYQQATQHLDHPMVWYNYGNALALVGRYAEAVNAYHKSLEKAPCFFEVLNNLGSIYLRMGKGDAALACYEKAVSNGYKDEKVFTNLGQLFLRAGLTKRALHSFIQALQLNPSNYGALYGYFRTQGALCDWQDLSRLHTCLLEPVFHNPQLIAEEPFLLGQLPVESTNKEQLLFSRLMAQRITVGLQPITGGICPQTAEIGERPLRIGYVSADFRDHPVGQLMLPIFETHNRERVEVFAYSLSEDDQSVYHEKIRQCVDQFRDFSSVDSREAARQIQADGIDVLVDLMGHSNQNRLGIFALRPAPVQVTYLGYPGTTGGHFMDYLIADPIVVPLEERKYFTEKVVYLANSYFPPGDGLACEKGKVTRSEAGLPEQGSVFCCFNSHYKIEPKVFTAWMEILQRVPGSVLWLSEAAAEVQSNLQREAEKRNVAGERLVFARRLADKRQHLARLAMADVFLDTFFYGAHTTACDALAAGVPVVTLAGKSFASRVGASLLCALGMPELITHSSNDYVEQATRLAADERTLWELKQKLERNKKTGALFDRKSYVQNLEQVYFNIKAR